MIKETISYELDTSGQEVNPEIQNNITRVSGALLTRAEVTILKKNITFQVKK